MNFSGLLFVLFPEQIGLVPPESKPEALPFPDHRLMPMKNCLQDTDLLLYNFHNRIPAHFE